MSAIKTHPVLGALLIFVSMSACAPAPVVTTKRETMKNYNINKIQQVNVGSPMIISSDITYVTRKVFVGYCVTPGGWKEDSYTSNDSIKEELLYTGRSGNTISISYREYLQNLARPAFYQELHYDLSQSDIIVFRKFRVKVLGANNEFISFQVLADSSGSRPGEWNSKNEKEDSQGAEVPTTGPEVKPTMDKTDKEKGAKVSSDRTVEPALSRRISPTSEQGASPKQEYWSWGLGALVKTERNTVITKFSDVGHSSARTDLKIGDEIVRIGEQDISIENAYKILTRPMPKEADGLVPIMVRRDGQDISIRIKPNEF